MLFSHAKEDKSRQMLCSLIRIIINQPNEHESQRTNLERYVRSIISEAKELNEGTKDFCSINRENFDFIVFLNQHNADLLKEVDPNNIQKRHYEKLLVTFDSVECELV